MLPERRSKSSCYRLKTPDAIHIATAKDVEVLLTNEPRRVKELSMIVLDDLI